MTSTAAFMATATADCPVSDITVKGWKTGDTALATDVAAYSDGYHATVTMTDNLLFLANALQNATTAAVLNFAFGAGTMTVAAGNTMGAYNIIVSETNADALLLGVISFFASTKAIDTATAANFAVMTTSKYGAVVPAAGAAWVDGSVLTTSFYMPSVPTTAATAETVAAVGDRLETGDVVAMWTGYSTAGTVIVAACGSGATMVLGAATLAAGSAAFAAALAF